MLPGSRGASAPCRSKTATSAERLAACAGHHLAQGERRAGGRVALHAVVRLDDFHIVVRIRARPRRMPPACASTATPTLVFGATSTGMCCAAASSLRARRGVDAGGADQQRYVALRRMRARVPRRGCGTLKSSATRAASSAARASAVIGTPVASPSLAASRPKRAARRRRKGAREVQRLERLRGGSRSARMQRLAHASRDAENRDSRHGAASAA